MSKTLPPSLGTTFNAPKEFLDIRKSLLTNSASTKTQDAIIVISDGHVPAFMMTSALIHLASYDGLWLAPPHTKAAAYLRLDNSTPLTVAEATLNDTYDDLGCDTPLNNASNASNAGNMQLRSHAGGTTTAGTAPSAAPEPTNATSRKRPSTSLIERAAKIRQDAEMALLTRYNDAARLIFAQLRYHLSDAAATTLEANADWTAAQLNNDLVRAWHTFTEVALFKYTPKRTFAETLLYALHTSDEYRLSFCDSWATFTSRWISAKTLLNYADHSIPESKIVHHFAAALVGDTAYAEVMLQLRNEDNRYTIPVEALTKARSSLGCAIEYAEYAKTRSDTLFKQAGPTVYFTAPHRPPPTVMTITVPDASADTRDSRATKQCRFHLLTKCKYGDLCSRMHGADDRRFANGKLRPEYVKRVKESVAAWKLARVQNPADNPLLPQSN